jgi:hypothetical protein
MLNTSPVVHNLLLSFLCYISYLHVHLLEIQICSDDNQITHLCCTEQGVIFLMETKLHLWLITHATRMYGE